MGKKATKAERRVVEHQTVGRQVTPQPSPAGSALPPKLVTSPQTQTQVPEDAVLVWDLGALTEERRRALDSGARIHFALLVSGEPLVKRILSQMDGEDFPGLVQRAIDGIRILGCHCAVIPLYHQDLLRMPSEERLQAARRARLPEPLAQALAAGGEEMERIFGHVVSLWDSDPPTLAEILLSFDPAWPRGRALRVCRDVLAPSFLRHRPWVLVGGKEWAKATRQAGFDFLDAQGL